jgi:phage terminase large subunit-like protein
MVTRRNAQLWAVSTAGTARSVWWRGRVDAGRAAVETGVSAGFAHFEWAAPPDADPADPETWQRCMPAMGATVDEETVAADFEAMKSKPDEFRRAYLNQWSDELDSGGWRLIDRGAWEASAW